MIIYSQLLNLQNWNFSHVNFCIEIFGQTYINNIGTYALRDILKGFKGSGILEQGGVSLYITNLWHRPMNFIYKADI